MDGMQDLLDQVKREMDRQLAEVLRAHGVDPDDRSEGWEARACEVFRGFEFEWCTEGELSGPGRPAFAAMITLRLRPAAG